SRLCLGLFRTCPTRASTSWYARSASVPELKTLLALSPIREDSSPSANSIQSAPSRSATGVPASSRRRKNFFKEPFVFRDPFGEPVRGRFRDKDGFCSPADSARMYANEARYCFHSADVPTIFARCSFLSDSSSSTRTSLFSAFASLI